MGYSKTFNKYDIVGSDINGIMVLSYSHTEKINETIHHFYNCQCICGKVTLFKRDALKYRKTYSCGCIGRKTHGDTGSPLYIRWTSMKGRVLNKNYGKSNNYGGRGISLDPRWMKYEYFKKDMGDLFYKHVEEFGLEETTLDRIDVNGGYSKDNCRWANNATQSMNKTNTVYVTYKNQKKTLKDWCNILNINYSVIRIRLKRGYSPEEAFEIPIKEFKQKKLTPELVIKVREMISKGYQNKYISEILGVHKTSIINIKNNKCYKNI